MCISLSLRNFELFLETAMNYLLLSYAMFTKANYPFKCESTAIRPLCSTGTMMSNASVVHRVRPYMMSLTVPRCALIPLLPVLRSSGMNALLKLDEIA